MFSVAMPMDCQEACSEGTCPLSIGESVQYRHTQETLDAPL